VSNGINTSETVVYFNENAAVGFDDYDSPIMISNSLSLPELYTMAGIEKVIINGFPAIVIDQEIPLGFMTLSANTFTLRVSEFSNMPADIRLMLSDQSTGANFDLTAGQYYGFTSDITDTLNRFSLIFRSNTTTTGNSSAPLNSLMQVFANANHQIVISNAGVLPENATVTVVNLLGQQIIHQPLIHAATTLSPALQSGIYLVKVSNCETRRVIIW
jgi:hypothetical protein